MLKIDIQIYKCDFETAQFTAYKTVYLNAKVSGCYFDFCKGVCDNAEKKGLTSTLSGKEIISLKQNLPFLPSNLITQAWNDVVKKGPKCD